MKYVNCNGMMRKSGYLSQDTCIILVKVRAHALLYLNTPSKIPHGGGGEWEGRFNHEQKNVYSMFIRVQIITCTLCPVI